MPDHLRLQDKIAIITGASRGIGRAIALRLARDGAAVVLTARDQQALNTAVAEIEKQGGQAFAIALDLRQPDAAVRIVDAARDRFGKIDILINNAGATKRGDFLELTDHDWTDGFALKFFGTVRLARAAWPYLKARSGSIVNIAGNGGRTPGPHFAIGGSVNAAILSLTKALAATGVADSVQVNAINPGPVRTARLARRLADNARRLGIDTDEAERRMLQEANIMRIGEPEDVANLVSFLVSIEGRLIHGALIDIDSGETRTI